jgi:hypothetical protein
MLQQPDDRPRVLGGEPGIDLAGPVVRPVAVLMAQAGLLADDLELSSGSTGSTCDPVKNVDTPDPVQPECRPAAFDKDAVNASLGRIRDRLRNRAAGERSSTNAGPDARLTRSGPP